MIPLVTPWLALRWVRAALVVVVLGAAAAAGWTVEHWRLGAQIARVQRDLEADARRDSEAARESERLGRVARDRSLDHAHAQAAAARRDAAGARRTADLLRDAAVRIAAARDAAGEPTAVAAGQDGPGPGLVRADVLRGLVAAAAADAAELGRAGADMVSALALARVANEQCAAEHAIARGVVERLRAEVVP